MIWKHRILHVSAKTYERNPHWGLCQSMKSLAQTSFKGPKMACTVIFFIHVSNIEENQEAYLTCTEAYVHSFLWSKVQIRKNTGQFSQFVLAVYFLAIMLCLILIIYQSSIYASLFIYRILQELINMDGYDF